jgi:hypothetical protein
MVLNRWTLIWAFALGGCAIPGAPVGWGGTHEAVQKNEESITYLYDPIVGGYGAMMGDATAHCGSFGKSPVPTVQGRNGALWTQTFECR